MNAPSIWPRSIARVERAADVVQHVGPQQPRLAGECVDHDFADCRAIREVEERLALQRLAVPVQAGCGVEAVGPQLHAREVRLLHQRVEGDALLAGKHGVVGKAHLRRRHVVALGSERCQPLTDLARGVLRGLAVQVGAGRCGGGRRVGDLLRVGGGAAHARQRHAELVRHHLRHLGVQALAHLGAAVVDQDRAVDVHVHQRTCLVEVREIEGDAELHRRDGEAALEHRAGGIERRDLLAPRAGSRWCRSARRPARGSRCRRPPGRRA